MLATGLAIGGEARMGQKESERTSGTSIEQAIKAATQKCPGKVLKAELEDEDGSTIWGTSSLPTARKSRCRWMAAPVRSSPAKRPRARSRSKRGSVSG